MYKWAVRITDARRVLAIRHQFQRASPIRFFIIALPAVHSLPTFTAVNPSANTPDLVERARRVFPHWGGMLPPGAEAHQPGIDSKRRTRRDWIVLA